MECITLDYAAYMDSRMEELMSLEEEPSLETLDGFLDCLLGVEVEGETSSLAVKYPFYVSLFSNTMINRPIVNTIRYTLRVDPTLRSNGRYRAIRYLL